MAYTPFTRHLNNDILSAYKNPQASGATGRAVVAGLGAPAARRALRQGATLPSATSSTAAVEALGQGGGLSTVIDSPEPGQGGQGPMEGGAAPMGLGSSSSSMESTRGPGRDVSSGVEMSEGAKDILGKLSSSSALNFGKNYAKYGGLVNPVELAMGSIFQAVPGVGLGVGLGALNKLGGDIINENRQEDRDTALQAVIDNTTDEDFATGRLGGLAEATAPIEKVDSALDALGDFFGIDDFFGPDISSDVSIDGPLGLPGYDAAVSARADHTAKVKAMDENQSIHDQMLSSLRNRGSSLPGHTVSNASAMAAARDLGKGQGLAVSGKGTPSQGPGTGPGNNATGGLAVGGSNAKGGGLSVGVGGSSSNGSNKGDSGGDDSIICSELYRQGLMTKRDRMLGYRHSLRHLSPTTLRGYHVWARPVVRAMKRSQRVTALWRWVWMRRHNEVERAMGKSTKRDIVGMGIRWALESFSWVVGACCSLDPVNARFDRKKA